MKETSRKIKEFSFERDRCEYQGEYNQAKVWKLEP